MVDGMESPEPGVGSAKVSSADTNDPLYIGGVPDASAKGIQTSDNYVGCIRNLRLNDQPQALSSGQVTGDIQLDSCPVN
ncbi:laminin subunit alpha-like [Babylonia areolata]